MQQIIETESCITTLQGALQRLGCSRFLLVCGKTFQQGTLFKHLKDIGIPFSVFDNFKPNPLYEDVCKGLDLFREHRCDVVVAIGGGSAMDVAKCVKLYSPMESGRDYLSLTPSDSEIPLIAIPTTAGTGSESTQYAVIYKDGIKQSVHHQSILPDIAILDSGLLSSLPPYQKKCTLLDALCQAIESLWSVNATVESQLIAQHSIHGIMNHYREYLQNDSYAARQIMKAANQAGQAIAITQTTAPHAMSYKLTSIYGIPHGHAVALCLPEVWDYMNNHSPVDENLNLRFKTIADSLGCENIECGIKRFRDLLLELDIKAPLLGNETNLDILAASVNTTRLKNNPIPLSYPTLYQLYKQLFS